MFNLKSMLKMRIQDTIEECEKYYVLQLLREFPKGSIDATVREINNYIARNLDRLAYIYKRIYEGWNKDVKHQDFEWCGDISDIDTIIQRFKDAQITLEELADDVYATGLTKLADFLMKYVSVYKKPVQNADDKMRLTIENYREILKNLPYMYQGPESDFIRERLTQVSFYISIVKQQTENINSNEGPYDAYGDGLYPKKEIKRPSGKGLLCD